MPGGARASACREAVLRVLDTNERAQSFYQAGGWRPDGAVRQEELAGFALREVRYRRRLARGPAALTVHAGPAGTAPVNKTFARQSGLDP